MARHNEVAHNMDLRKYGLVMQVTIVPISRRCRTMHIHAIHTHAYI